MKKLILLSALCLFGLFQVKAQGQLTVTTMTSDTGVANTTAGYSTSAAQLNGWDVVGIQALVTKFSGTVTGSAKLQGSLDGTNYVQIATDTLALTNVSTVQTYIWIVTPSKYKYYRIKYTPAGTMNIHVVGKLETIYKN